MQQLTDLDLPHLAMEDPVFAADPFTPFSQAREQHPWLATCSFGYVITEFKALRELMEHEDKMHTSHPDMVEMLGAQGTPWGNFIVGSIQAQSGEVHARLRAVLAPAFTPRRANAHRPLMRETVTRVLDEWVPRGAFDFEQFASCFPVQVMCSIIGAPTDELPRLRSSLEVLGQGGAMEASLLPAFQSAYLTLDSFVRELVAERRANLHDKNDGPDLLDTLLDANGEGGLSDEELYNLLVFLFVAGYDTSKNTLTLAVYALLDRPDDYERCARDPAFCRKVTNETLRYFGVASLGRIVDEPFEFRNVYLPEKTNMFLPWGTLGRDPRAFENADAFDPERPDGRHLGFGLGPHICLGQFIARAQIEEGLHLVAQRIKHPRLVREPGWRLYPGAWGIRGLSIEFDQPLN